MKTVSVSACQAADIRRTRLTSRAGTAKRMRLFGARHIIFHDVKRINTICVVDTVTPCNECDVRYFCSSMCHAVNTNIYNNNQLKEKRCEQYKNLLEKHVWGI